MVIPPYTIQYVKIYMYVSSSLHVHVHVQYMQNYACIIITEQRKQLHVPIRTSSTAIRQEEGTSLQTGKSAEGSTLPEA